MEQRALDPYLIRLGDGKEYEFFGSWWALKKLAKATMAHNKKGSEDESLPLDMLSQALYDFCTSKGEMKLEDFERILPGNGEWLTAHIAAIQNHSTTACSERPIEASVEPLPTTTGSEVGQPAEPSLESVTPNSGD